MQKRLLLTKRYIAGNAAFHPFFLVQSLLKFTVIINFIVLICVFFHKFFIYLIQAEISAQGGEFIEIVGVFQHSEK